MPCPRSQLVKAELVPGCMLFDDCVILGEFSVGFVYERLNSDSVAIILLFKY